MGFVFVFTLMIVFFILNFIIMTLLSVTFFIKSRLINSGFNEVLPIIKWGKRGRYGEGEGEPRGYQYPPHSFHLYKCRAHESITVQIKLRTPMFSEKSMLVCGCNLEGR